MLEILDAIIATGAVVLAISLIVQAIQQILKQFFSLKSSYMERELVMMFLSDDGLKDFFKQWKNISERLTPDWKIFKSIGEKERQIVDELKIKLRSIGYKDLEILEQITIEQMQTIICGLPMFSGMEKEGENLLKHTLGDVKDWFEITKRAFQDHYERKMKVWAFAISAVVVLALNANLFDVYHDFSQNKTLRDAAVVWAEKVTSQPRDSIITIRKEGLPDTVMVKQKSDTAIATEIKKNIADIQALVNDNSFQIVRWNKFQKWCGPLWLERLAISVGGWLGMILLVSLGAPFWYDLLKTLMGIKNQLKDTRRNK
jgi:hypothetical protein